MHWLTSGPTWRGPLVIWIMAFLFVAVTTGDFFGSASVRNYQLATQGQKATGKIAALELSNHGGCRYTYIVDGSQYSHSESRCGSGRNVGDTLTVTYLPSHRGVSTSGDAAGSLRDGLLLMFLAPTLLAAFFYVGNRRRSLQGQSGSPF